MGFARSLAWSIVLVALVLPAPARAASKVCERLLAAPDYDLELPLIGQVRDQCGGTCWLSAGLTLVEQSVHAQSGREIPLSEDYLIAMELKHQALASVMNRTEDVPRLQGKTFPHVEWLIREYGLVPKSEFSPQPADWDRIGQALARAARPFLAKKRLSADGEEQLSKALDQVLEQALGKLPRSFTVAGKRHTPESFADAFVPARTFRTFFLKEKGVADPLNLHFSLRDVLGRVKDSLAAGHAVYASLRWPEQWHGARGGLLNLDPKQLDGVKFEGLHAVAIVGAKVNAKGEITALKLQNSWGDGQGDEGFFHIPKGALEVVLQYVVIAN